MIPNDTGKWLVQVGRDTPRSRGKYKTRYALGGGEIHNSRAFLYYSSINIGNGYKKRLVAPDGRLVARQFS